MRAFLNELRKRNKTLYFFGCLNLIGALVCIILTKADNTQVLGISAWIKPMKFFLSITILSFTMGWLLYYLHEDRKVRLYNYMFLTVLIFEQVYICIQAARGQQSHFNFSSTTTIILYSLMGIAITVLAVWSGYFGFLFYKKSMPELTKTYLWGIRLGFLIFVIFSLGAHVMASSTGHTVGAPDGGPGLPFVNWNKQHGDLRIAHFFGMHALQILPLVGFYVTKSVRNIVSVSLMYFALIVAVFIQALSGHSLFGQEKFLSHFKNGFQGFLKKNDGIIFTPLTLNYYYAQLVKSAYRRLWC